MKTLVVEDGVIVREMLVAMLTERGHEVCAFGDAESGLEAHRSDPFDMMILDWMLPGMTGIELCREVRASPGGQEVVILVFTSQDKPSDIQTVMEAGASDYLAKSADFEQLEIRIAVAEHRKAEIDKRLAAEEDLRTTRENLAFVSTILDSIGDAIIATDKSLTIDHANSEALRLVDTDLGETVGQALPEVFRLNGEKSSNALAQHVIASGRTLRLEHDTTLLALDGTSRPITCSCSPIRGATGCIEGLVFAFRDLSKTNKAMEALRTAENRDTALLRAVPDVLACLSLDGRILSFNAGPSADNPFETDSVGKNLEQVLPGEVTDQMRGCMRNVTSSDTTDTMEFELGAGDSVRNFEARFVKFDEDKILVVIRNIDERKQLETRLRLSDRMVSIGTLAAGVAHEMNNPLAYINSNINYVIEEVSCVTQSLPRDQGEELRDALRESSEGVRRLRRIVNDLKTLSRSDETVDFVDPQSVIETSINMAWNQIRHRARLVKDFQKTKKVKGSEGRLCQVLLNLLVNAAQAIPEGCVKDNEIRIGTVDEDDRICIFVQDTGPGIPPESQPRVFDPFFTTKPVGIGTGLGLSICHGIIKSFGGEISFETRQGKGTTFRVVLPAATKEETRETVHTEVIDLTTNQKAKVLIIDDEELVSRAFRRCLRAHEVTTAISGREAIALCQSVDFDIIFCDIMMPDLSGVDVYNHVRQHLPGVEHKIVFMTGNAFTHQAREFLGKVPNRSIEKPFDNNEIKKLVRESLKQRHQSPASRLSNVSGFPR